jgi:hypothetical protein
MTLAVLQAITPAGSTLSLGAWIAVAVAVVGLLTSLVVGVWRLAVISTKTGQLEGFVARELIIINEKLDSLTTRAEEADKLKIADVRWATETTTRLGSVERRVEVMDTERRGGLTDRRQTT